MRLAQYAVRLSPPGTYQLITSVQIIQTQEHTKRQCIPVLQQIKTPTPIILAQTPTNQGPQLDLQHHQEQSQIETTPQTMITQRMIVINKEGRFILFHHT